MERIKSIFTDGRLAVIGSCLIFMVNGCVFLQNGLENYLKSFFFHFNKDSKVSLDTDKIWFLLIDEISNKLGYLVGAYMFNFMNLNVRT